MLEERLLIQNQIQEIDHLTEEIREEAHRIQECVLAALKSGNKELFKMYAHDLKPMAHNLLEIQEERQKLDELLEFVH